MKATLSAAGRVIEVEGTLEEIEHLAEAFLNGTSYHRKPLKGPVKAPARHRNGTKKTPPKVQEELNLPTTLADIKTNKDAQRVADSIMAQYRQKSPRRQSKPKQLPPEEPKRMGRPESPERAQERAAIITLLGKHGPTQFAELQERTGINSKRLGQAISMLQRKGEITQEEGGHWRLT